MTGKLQLLHSIVMQFHLSISDKSKSYFFIYTSFQPKQKISAVENSNIEKTRELAFNEINFKYESQLQMLVEYIARTAAEKYLLTDFY